jgi:hypothetical protein
MAVEVIFNYNLQSFGQFTDYNRSNRIGINLPDFAVNISELETVVWAKTLNVLR